MSESAACVGAPPTWDGQTNMEYANPGTADWVKEAWARLQRLHEDFETLNQWAAENTKGDDFAEQVMLDTAARLAEWDQLVRTWEP